MEYSTPGECIRDLINDKGSTLINEAAALDIAQSTLSDIVNNKRAIRSDTLKKICSHFNVSSDYILGLSPDPTPDATVQGVVRATGLSGKAGDRLCALNDRERRFLNDLLSSADALYFIAAAYTELKDKKALEKALEDGLLSDDYGPDTLMIKNDLDFKRFTLQNRFLLFADK